MRKPKKKQAQAVTPEDQEFARLYHTIPANGQLRGAVQSEKPEELPPQRPKWKVLLKRGLIILLILLALCGVWVGWKFVSNEVKIFGWRGIVDALKTTKLKGEDQGRVTILLAGNSADDAGHGGAELTDSIMLASIDTKNKTGYIMSIPRDFYVGIPGFGYAKINEAYQDGKRSNFSGAGYPVGGMGLLEKTVDQAFGVKAQYYALVDYTALEQSVNAVGGIDVNIQSSDPRGLYDPSRDLQTGKPLVKLPNGTVHLDGRAALDLSRARGHDRGAYGYGSGDFTRTENQRKILLGIKDKAGSLGTLSNPVKLGELFDSLGNNVQTDLKASEVRRLFQLSKQIPSSKVQSASLDNVDGKDLLKSYTTRNGQYALIPALGVDDYTDIRAFVSRLQAVPEPTRN